MHLRIYADLTAVEPAWRYLEQHGIATVYQTYDWCSSWCKTVIQARKASPVIVLAEDDFGRPLFILPLQQRCIYGLNVIEVLSSPQCTYGFGLFDRAFHETAAGSWFAENMHHVQSMLPPHDVLRIADAPESVNGLPNPLLAVRHFRAANHSYFMMLRPDFNDLLASKRSQETRRGLRKRDAKLAAEGALAFGLPPVGPQMDLVLETMFADQEKRLASAGVHNVYDAHERQFVHELGRVETVEGPLLKPFHLTLDGITLSVMLGAYYNKTYWALISSLADGQVRRHSPGDYAMRAMFKSLCENGTERLDFAAGDTAYKLHWADECVPLFVVIRSNSLRGMGLGLLMLLREKMKLFAKKNVVLRSSLFQLRKLLWGRSG